MFFDGCIDAILNKKGLRFLSRKPFIFNQPERRKIYIKVLLSCKFLQAHHFHYSLQLNFA
jgi:hypothetical protein